jgi:type IV pilus assembly protein PilB
MIGMLNNGLFNKTLLQAMTAAGLLDSGLADELLTQSVDEGISLTQLLLRRQAGACQAMAEIIAHQLGYPCADLSALEIDPGRIKVAGYERFLKQHILPLWANDTHIAVAFADPACLAVIDDLRLQCGLLAEPVVVDQHQLNLVLDQLSAGRPAPEPHTLAEQHESEVPVVRFVDRILLQATRAKVSDIHMEPFEHCFRVRFRKDGLLHNIEDIPSHLGNSVNSRLKVMADLDITERRRPQDGRLQFVHASNIKADMRISSLPTVWGEKLVLRIMASNGPALHTNQLGMEPGQQSLWLQALARPQGMVLVTGPTGSGKSNTLYTALAALNSPERNIFTVEDPVEALLQGINQVNVNTTTGLTFGNALRAFLRQDPDIIMLGEIRDQETADMAVKAAQTGHLLLSTLHTNSAAETITRLLNMGVAAYNLSSALSLIVAQRLCRLLCPHCKRPAGPTTAPTVEQLQAAGMSDDMLETLQLHDAVGCQHCRNGYLGRIGIFEVLPVTPDFAEHISNGLKARQLRETYDEMDIMSLRQAGLWKVARGLTTLAELNRVCP